MGDVRPFPKSTQLARGERRYKRKVASSKQWQAISEAKRGPCRVCSDRNPTLLELHHFAITRRVETISRLLLSRLSDAEYAYAIQHGGEDYFERAYGVSYER